MLGIQTNVVLQAIRETLRSLGSNSGANTLTFKSWRAGKAYERAKIGMHISDMLMMGGWKRCAFLRYGQPDSIDSNLLQPLSVLEAAMELSDKEGETDG